MRHLEVCAGTINSVLSAREGGAYRVELCSGLDEGGLTPSSGFIRAAMRVDGIRKNVLIRPRGGDFLYNAAEKFVILEDIRMCREEGVDGVVIGALTPEGEIDMDFCALCVEEAGDMSVTFHRAFDLCADPLKALDDVISLGCDRLLTSGQAAKAEGGVEMLKTLVERAGERLIVMPGSGVNAANAAKILKETGAREIHASARSMVKSAMASRRAGVSMGKEGVDEYSIMETDADVVRRIVEEIERI